jgi:hypothetical protein
LSVGGEIVPSGLSPKKGTFTEDRSTCLEAARPDQALTLRFPASAVATAHGLLLVTMLGTGSVTDTDEVAGLSASMTASPPNSLKAPRTLVAILCRATNPKRLFAESIVQVPVGTRKSHVVAGHFA